MLVVVLIIATSGMLQASSAENKYTKDNPLIINFGHEDSNPDPYMNNKKTTAVLLKYYLENISGGRITLKEYPGTLGGAVETLKQIQLGVIQMGVPHEGPTSTIFPIVQVLAIPYLFANEYVADYVLDGWFGKEFAEEFLKQTGLRCLSFYSNSGFRHIVTSDKPVRSLEDLKGLKLRTVESEANMKIIELMGAKATPIPWAEVYTAIQTGIVDGLDNNANGVLVGTLYEVTKYITMEGHVYAPGLIVVNEQWFQSLPIEFQNYIKEAVEVSKWGSRVIVRMIEALGYERLAKEEGMEIIHLSKDDKASLKEKTQGPFTEWLRKRVDPAWVDKVLKAVKEAEQSRQFYK